MSFGHLFNPAVQRDFSIVRLTQGKFAEYNPLNALRGAVYLGRNGMFLMLSAYFDETGHSRDPRKSFVGMAGFLARADAWERFDSEWRQVCDSANVKMPFHMTDFAHCRGQFRNWQEDGRKKLLSRLIDVIGRTKAIPVGAIVSVRDFQGLGDKQRSELRDPYYIAFQECTYNLAFAAAITSPEEKVAMVYAKQREFTGGAEELWYAIKKHNPLVGYWMNSYTPAEPVDFTPLQTADLWAYELGHHFEYILPNAKDWRYAFERIVRLAIEVSAGHRFFTYLDRREMLMRLGEI